MAKIFSDKYLTSLKAKVKAYTVREAKWVYLQNLALWSQTRLYIYEIGGKRKQHNLGTYPDSFVLFQKIHQRFSSELNHFIFHFRSPVIKTSA